jgi:hypothetical protein
MDIRTIPVEKLRFRGDNDEILFVLENPKSMRSTDQLIIVSVEAINYDSYEVASNFCGTDGRVNLNGSEHCCDVLVKGPTVEELEARIAELERELAIANAAISDALPGK